MQQLTEQEIIRREKLQTAETDGDRALSGSGI